MTDDLTDSRLHRRTLLRGAAIASLAVPVVAACGSSNDKSASGGSTSSDDPSNSGDDPSSSGNDPSSGSDDSSSSGGKDLTSTSAIPTGGGKVFASQRVVVTQPKSGKFKCFTAVCTHQGCIVADVSGGTINCNCHGSRFSISTGAVEGGPAPSALAAVGFEVSGNEIKLT